MATVEKALDLAEAGLFVFPVAFSAKENTKKPYTHDGHLSATQDPGVIQDWWAAHPKAEVGVATGKSGIAVADVDTKNGKDGWASLDEAWVDLGEPFSYETGTGGSHLVYTAPAGLDLNGTANYRGMEGVDRRAGSSWVMWVGPVPEKGDLHPAPGWLLDEARVRAVQGFGGSVAEWYKSLTPGAPNALVRKAMERVSDDPSHSDMVAATYEAIRLGAEGNAGVPDLIELLEDAWMNRPAENHTTPEGDWEFKFQEAMTGGLEKYGETTDLVKNLPDYNISLVPASVPETLVTSPGGKPEFSKLLGLLIKEGLEDNRILSILWNCPGTRDLSRDWGLEFTNKRIQDARLKPEPTRENPRIEEKREAEEQADPGFRDFHLLTEAEVDYANRRPTFVDHFEDMARSFEYDQTPYFRANAWVTLAMSFAFHGFVPEGGAKKHGFNLWNVCLGDSGTGKTVVMEIRDMILKKVFADEIGSGLPLYDLGSNSSPQGVHAALLERDGRASILSGDEGAEFFKNVLNQRNSANFPESLTKWSNGYVDPVNKMTMKDEQKGKIALTALSSQFFSTPENLMNVLTRDLFKTGYLARMTWTIGLPKSQDDSIYDLTQSEEDLEFTGIPEVIDELARNLIVIRAFSEKKNKRIMASPAALQRMSQAYRKMDKVAQKRSNYDLTGPSVIRLKDTMMKCAGLAAMYRGSDSIELVDALHAIRSVDEWFQNLFIVADWVSEGEFQRACSQIESWIRDQPKGRSSGTRIRHKFGVFIKRDPRELENYLTHLVGSGILNRTEDKGEPYYEVNG